MLLMWMNRTSNFFLVLLIVPMYRDIYLTELCLRIKTTNQNTNLANGDIVIMKVAENC